MKSAEIRWWFLIASVVICAPVRAADLVSVSHKALVRVLANFEIAAERRELPYEVRVLRVRDPGECDLALESCPQSTAYITVSTFDEAPDQAVYRLAESYDWEFVRWLAWPAADGPQHYVVLVMKETVVVGQAENARKESIDREIRINPWSGSISELPGRP